MKTPGVDPALVETWVRGWALAREKDPPRAIEGAWRIDVNEPDQRARCIFPCASAALTGAAERESDKLVVFKVMGSPEAVASHLPLDWEVARATWMMASGPAGRRSGDRPVSLNAQGAIVRATIPLADGIEAASGRVALVNGWAIYDRIATHPDHRRRGLGAAVMGALAAAAAERGASRGVLVATPEGRVLYESLGWRVLSLYTTAQRRR